MVVVTRGHGGPRMCGWGWLRRVCVLGTGYSQVSCVIGANPRGAFKGAIFPFVGPEGVGAHSERFHPTLLNSTERQQAKVWIFFAGKKKKLAMPGTTGVVEENQVLVVESRPAPFGRLLLHDQDENHSGREASDVDKPRGIAAAHERLELRALDLALVPLAFGVLKLFHGPALRRPPILVAAAPAVKAKAGQTIARPPAMAL